MPIILDELKLSYTPIPKTACTSLKAMFFEVENGREFIPFKSSGAIFHIHKVYPSTLFSAELGERQSCYRRLLLVRDPIRRLLSAYSNRVAHHRELSLEKAGKALKKHDLAPDPTLHEFILNLPKYAQAVKTIDHHTRPLVDYAGRDASFYTRVYKLSEIEDMLADISTIAGRPQTLRRLQTGGPKLSMNDLRRHEIDRLREFYAQDYLSYGEYFDA